MALVIDNCLIQQGSGVNEMYEYCCCTFQCFVTNTGDLTTITGDLVQFSGPFIVKNIQINGNPPSYPFSLDKNASFSFEFQVCADIESGNSDSLIIRFYDTTGTAGTFYFDFTSINLSTSIDVASLEINNIPIGSSGIAPITIYNPTACCYNYDITTDCDDVQPNISPTPKLCNGDSQIVNIVYTPTVVGGVFCSLTLSNDCGSWNIPVTLSAIPGPTPQGTSNGQKNKVDQTTPVANCSPRTANNRCQTARTMQSAIRTNARRFGKR